MKKKILSLLLTSALLTGGAANVMADTDISVTVDGNAVAFTDVTPEIVDGITYVPVRGVFENIGAKVDYMDETETVVIDCNNVNLRFVIGSNTVAVTKNNETKNVTLDKAIYIKNDRTLVPFRFISETLGYDVDWDETSKTASVTTNTRKALDLINSFATGDTSVAENILTENYIQHNLAYGTGRAAFIASIEALASAPVKTTVNNVRAFSDGDYVFLQTVYNFAGAGEQVAFDIFRFENGKIAEHWDNLAAKAEPNPSGRTQIDGATEVKELDKTEENKQIAANFIKDVLVGENSDNLTSYFIGNEYIQHNTGIADGLDGLGAALAAYAEQGIEMIYTDTPIILGQGNFVLAASEGTLGGVPTAFYDMWRIENGKIIEHWDVIETIPDESTWANENGKF